MPSTVLAWRNWCAEVGTISATAGTFETAAPLTNLLTPRTGELAIATAEGVTSTFVVTFAGSTESPPVVRPVRLLGLLNHNIVEVADPDDILFTINTPTVSVQVNGNNLAFVTALDFQSHIFLVLPDTTPAENVTSVEISVLAAVVCGAKDPYTGVVTEAPFQAGGIWAGPIWEPEYGARFDSFQQGVSEIARGARSIGGQFYPNPEPRFRKGQLEFALLSEPEVYSTDVAQPSLQQLAAWCARSRPLIVIPTQGDPDLIYTQGIYGYLEGDPSWQLKDRAHSEAAGSKGRVYSGGLSIAEAL